MNIIYLITILIFVMLFTTSQAFGHGLSYDIIQSEIAEQGDYSLGLGGSYSKKVQDHVELSIHLFDTKSKDSIQNVTFLLKVYHNGNEISNKEFQADEGRVVFDLDLTSDKIILLDDLEYDPENKVTLAPYSDFGGLYNFEIQVLTTDDYDNTLDEPLDFQAGLSFPAIAYHEFDDPDFGKHEIGIIGYYDKVRDISYNPEDKSINFEMSFDWPSHSTNDLFFIHNEFLIPKTIGDYRVANFSASVNGIDHTESLYSIDHFLDENLRIHLVTDGALLSELSEKFEKLGDSSPENLEFSLKPVNPDGGLSSPSPGGRYTINLTWDPPEIVSSSKTTFSVELLDIYTKDEPTPTEYHFTIIYDDEEIFHKSGLQTDPVTKKNEIEFDVPENVSGPITIRLENLGTGIFSNIDFPVLVNSIQTTRDGVITQTLDSPRKQMENGIEAENVECKSGLTLMKKYSGTAACVLPLTAEKLENAGWGTPVN